jgi:hypothetical protein
MKLLAAALGVAIAIGRVEGSAPSQPLVVRNVTMRVADTIEYLHFEPATFAVAWVDVAFDLSTSDRDARRSMIQDLLHLAGGLAPGNNEPWLRKKMRSRTLPGVGLDGIGARPWPQR